MRILIEEADQGRIVDATDGQTFASVDRTNILAGSFTLPQRAGCDRLVVWSGALGPSLFEPSPLNWSGPGHEALRSLLDHHRIVLEEIGLRLLIQPHFNHVMSDIPSCVSLGRERAGQPVRLALSPATMLAPSMRTALDDHLTRMFETLGADAEMVFLHDVVFHGDDLPPKVAPLGQGSLSRTLVRRLIEEYVSDETPVVVSDVDVEAQIRWLRG